MGFLSRFQPAKICVVRHSELAATSNILRGPRNIVAVLYPTCLQGYFDVLTFPIVGLRPIAVAFTIFY